MIKSIRIGILGLISLLFTYCQEREKPKETEIKKTQKKYEDINYLEIDSSLFRLSGDGYQRLDENWMKRRRLRFKELGIDTTIFNDWSTNSIIETNLDDDNVKDYIVIAKSQSNAPTDIHYAIIAVLGKSFKSYQLPDCSWSTKDLEDLPNEYSDDFGFTEYELPMVRLEKNENVTTVYCHSNRNVDSYNSYYYDTEKKHFENITYD